MVISLHGIRTTGEWQKRLAEVLSLYDFVYSPLDYGYFDLPRFILSGIIPGLKKIEWFQEKYETKLSEYREILKRGKVQRYPSVVAHSFGTCIVANALLKYPTIRLDKLILCASILPRDFPWDLIFDRGQLGTLRHEWGLKDVWTKIAKYVVRGTGDSGAVGFTTEDPRIRQRAFDYHRHSDFFGRLHLEEEWLPMLTAKPSRLTVKHGRELKNAKDWIAKRRQTRLIDQAAFGKLADFEQVGPSDALLESWFGIEPDIWTYLVAEETDQFVGFINAIPIRPDVFERLMRAGLPDREILPEYVASYAWDKEVCLVPIAIAIHKEWTSDEDQVAAVWRLLGAHLQKLELLAKERGVRVLQIGAVGWTPEGIRVCDLLGMTEEGRDRFGHPIFRLRLDRDAVHQRHHRFAPMRRLATTYRQEGEKRGWWASEAPPVVRR